VIAVKCDKCHDLLEQGEARELHGRVLCEDCYMDALSPPKTCDPWAVHSAKSFAKQSGTETPLNPTQQRILNILSETGGVEPKVLSERLQIKPADLEREIAALRHMEKLRGELRDGRKIVRLW
jgi:hypothetical protein